MSPALSTTFRSLRVRNYRLFAGGQVVSLSGTWGQRVAQDWLVLELSHDSGVALGITIALQFLPVLLFGLWGGLLADRYDKRKLLVIVQVAMGLQALALGVLDVAGVVELWHVWALAFGLGVASAIDTPVRQSFVVEMVGPDELPNAVSLNSATFNSARIVGPAVAGLTIAVAGTGTVFLGNAVTYVAVVAGLLMMRPAELHQLSRVAKGKGQLREGFAYVRARPRLLVPIALVFVVGTFGFNFQLTTSLLAREVFDRGAGSFGLLTSMLAVGSLAGALATARRSGPPRMKVMLLSGAAFGLLEAVTALAPTFETMAVLLVPTGIAALTFTTTANAVVQTSSETHVRGRVMAIYILVFLGGTPVGAPLIGALAEAFGPRASMLVGGAVCALAAGVAALWLARAERLQLEAHLVPRPHLHVRPMAGAASRS